ncbi:MAG: hypothetical protein ACOYOB_12065 [Myxococcota bacterium]|jgi:hypothetical protein
MMSKSLKIAGWLSVAALAGCGARESRPVPQTSVAQARPVVVTSQRVELPLHLTLTGSAEGDRVTLRAVVRVTGHLPAPAILKVVLPEGAALESGLPVDRLGELAQDTVTERSFVVTGLKGPVRVTVESSSDAAGFEAHAQWPEAPAAAVEVAPRMEPVAPVKILGIQVDKAVPVAPGK